MTDSQYGLFERLQRVFRETLDDHSMKITKNTTQVDILEWDSMFQIILIMGIEREFGVRLTAKDISRLVSVRIILDFLETKGLQTPAERIDKGQ